VLRRVRRASPCTDSPIRAGTTQLAEPPRTETEELAELAAELRFVVIAHAVPDLADVLDRFGE